MKNKIIFFLTIVILICVSQVSFSLVMPEIVFNERTFGSPNIGTSSPEGAACSLMFNRNLGISKANIISITEIPDHPAVLRQVNNSNLNLLILTDSSLDFSQQGVYILDKNAAVGYCLLEPVRINGYGNHEAVLNNIKAFPVNPNYLLTGLNIPANTSVTFYEKDNGNYVEVYAIGNTLKSEIFLLDAFYPKDLEGTLKPYIIDSINKNINKFSQLDLLN
jgi:hypothetical protein